MFCVQCGVELPENARFCSQCGVPTSNNTAGYTPQPLYRSAVDNKIAGVCGGLAKYFNMDPTVMRILWLILACGLPPAGIFGYIAAWIVMPLEPMPVYSTSAPSSV